MGGEAVAEHVRRNVSADAGTTNALFDAQPKSDCGEGRTAFCEEDGARRTGGNEFGPAGIEVMLKSGHGFAADGNDAFLVAFADDVNEPGLQVELFKPDTT